MGPFLGIYISSKLKKSDGKNMAEREVRLLCGEGTMDELLKANRKTAVIPDGPYRVGIVKKRGGKHV